MTEEQLDYFQAQIGYLSFALQKAFIECRRDTWQRNLLKNLEHRARFGEETLPQEESEIYDYPRA